MAPRRRGQLCRPSGPICHSWPTGQLRRTSHKYAIFDPENYDAEPEDNHITDPDAVASLVRIVYVVGPRVAWPQQVCACRGVWLFPALPFILMPMAFVLL